MKEILLNWVAVSSYSIQSLDQCITKCRRFIRFNTIISLAFSTASGSLSVTSYSKQASLVLNILLTVFSYFVVLRLFLFSVSHFVLNRLTSPCLSHAAHSRNWFYLPINKASLWTVFTPQASSPSSTICSAIPTSGS